MQQPQYVQYAPVAGQPQPLQPQQQQPAVITTQPVVATTTVINQAPSGPSRAIKRDWSSGIFDCCSDMGTCCGVLFCPFCSLCLLSSAMDEGCCMPIWVPLPLLVMRTKLRTQERIKGSILNDCCMATCCHMCALCQLKREYGLVQKVKASYNIQHAL